MKVVIVAAGIGSRLSKYTKEVIPKILLSSGKRPILIDMLEYWSKYSKDIIVITNSLYSGMVKSYANMYGYGIKVLEHNIADGSANAIMANITEPGNYLFVWSDIVPVDTFKEPENTTIFTDPGDYRYAIINNEIINVEGIQPGNVPGVYYIKGFNNLGTNKENLDFIDVLKEHYKDFDTKPLAVIDYGDEEKYKAALDKDGAKVRYFNSLEIKKDKVLKFPKGEKGKELAKIEKNWYTAVKRLAKDCIPEVNVKEDHIELERLDKTIAEYIKETNDTSIILNVYSLLHSLHSYNVPVTKDKLLRDVYIEASKKIKARFEEIFWFLLNSKYVNTKDVIECTNFLEKELLRYYKNYYGRYSLIHGDPQFSNIMLDSNNVPKLIDPRGYFGKTKLYGLREYDFAKVLYAIYGYDEFNNTLPYIQGTGFKAIDDLDKHIEYINQNYSIDEYVLRLWLGVILLGLPGYIKNDAQKLLDSTKEAIKYCKSLM